MATDQPQKTPEFLTRADIPELVKSMADAMLAQLRAPPAAEGSPSGSSSVEAGELAKWIYRRNPFPERS